MASHKRVPLRRLSVRQQRDRARAQARGFRNPYEQRKIREELRQRGIRTTSTDTKSQLLWKWIGDRRIVEMDDPVLDEMSSLFDIDVRDSAAFTALLSP